MDHHFFLFFEFLMSFVYFFIDPVIESCSYNSVDHVSKIRSGNLPHFFFYWKVVKNLRVFMRKFKKPFNFQSFILWNHYDFHAVILQNSLLSWGQISQMPINLMIRVSLEFLLTKLSLSHSYPDMLCTHMWEICISLTCFEI